MFPTLAALAPHSLQDHRRGCGENAAGLAPSAYQFVRRRSDSPWIARWGAAPLHCRLRLMVDAIGRAKSSV